MAARDLQELLARAARAPEDETAWRALAMACVRAGRPPPGMACPTLPGALAEILGHAPGDPQVRELLLEAMALDPTDAGAPGPLRARSRGGGPELVLVPGSVPGEEDPVRAFWVARRPLLRGELDGILGRPGPADGHPRRLVQGLGLATAVEACRRWTARSHGEDGMDPSWCWDLPTSEEWGHARRWMGAFLEVGEVAEWTWSAGGPRLLRSLDEPPFQAELRVEETGWGGPRDASLRPVLRAGQPAGALPVVDGPEEVRGEGPRLVRIADCRPVAAHPLEGPCTLGRRPDVEVPLLDPVVAGRHSRVVPESGGWVVEDMGSANRTFVRSRGAETFWPADRAPLAHGDSLAVAGCFVFVFLEEPDAAPVEEVCAFLRTAQGIG